MWIVGVRSPLIESKWMAARVSPLGIAVYSPVRTGFSFRFCHGTLVTVLCDESCPRRLDCRTQARALLLPGSGSYTASLNCAFRRILGHRTRPTGLFESGFGQIGVLPLEDEIDSPKVQASSRLFNNCPGDDQNSRKLETTVSIGMSGVQSRHSNFEST
jgi:hypothetical protein